MNLQTNTYNELRDLIEFGTKKYGCPIDIGWLKTLEMCCGFIDELISEFGGKEITFELDDKTLDIIIRVTLKAWFVVNGKDHEFYRLMTHAKSFAFEGVDGGEAMVAEYRFRGLWA